MTIATLPAAWNTNESRSPVADTAQLRRPAFRGCIGEDVLYASFAGVTPAEAVGSPTKADNRPGLFFLIAENPGDPRFELDPDGGDTPPKRATLSWAQLTLPPARVRDAAGAPLLCPMPTSTGPRPPATMANLVRQRPFRAFVARIAPRDPQPDVVDPNRLQPFFDLVSTATATHDGTARARRGHTGAASIRPARGLVPTAGCHAGGRRARTALETARRTLDLERLR
jgi:hypothetical protein